MNFINTTKYTDLNRKIYIYTNDDNHKQGLIPSDDIPSIPLAWRIMPFKITTDTTTEFSLSIIDSAHYDGGPDYIPSANPNGELLLLDSRGRSMWNRLRDKTTAEDASENKDLFMSEVLLYNYITNSNYIAGYKFTGGYFDDSKNWVYGYTDYLLKSDDTDIQATSFDDNYYLYFAADFDYARAEKEYEAIIYMECKVD